MEREQRSQVTSEAVTLALAESIDGARTGDWRRPALRELTLGTRRYGLPREFVATVRGFRGYIPDAFRISAGERALHFFEVELYNPMRDAKLEAYAALAIDMAAYGIDFGVYVVNRYGHINRVDLLPHYAAWLARHASA